MFIGILIRLLERHALGMPPTVERKEEDIMLSQMWENPAFRKHIATRNAKLIAQMAGGEGLKPEPRDAYCMHAGQRVENLILARDAKAAFTRVKKEQELKNVELGDTEVVD